VRAGAPVAWTPLMLPPNTTGRPWIHAEDGPGPRRSPTRGRRLSNTPIFRVAPRRAAHRCTVQSCGVWGLVSHRTCSGTPHDASLAPSVLREESQLTRPDRNVTRVRRTGRSVRSPGQRLVQIRVWPSRAPALSGGLVAAGVVVATSARERHDPDSRDRLAARHADWPHVDRVPSHRRSDVVVGVRAGAYLRVHDRRGISVQRARCRSFRR